MTKAICNLLLKQPPSPNLSQIEDGTTAFMGNSQDISDKTRLKWIKAISDMFFTRTELSSNSCVRDWNIILGLDGSVENIVDDIATPHAPEKKYPARYQLPSAISNSINTTETIHRAELFALGSILYQVISEKELFREMGSDEEDGETIQSLITEGKFPEDVWSLPMAPRILGCWCPEFAKKMLEANGKGPFLEIVYNYIRKHPVLFGFQVLGGIASLGSVFALPILGAIGFTAAGPLAGSAAAGWQSSIGIVQGGSFFAWCQSAAMGGAAMGGILVTGLAGGGVAVGATVAGALDTKVTEENFDLKQFFLEIWRQEVEMDQKNERGE